MKRLLLLTLLFTVNTKNCADRPGLRASPTFDPDSELTLYRCLEDSVQSPFDHEQGTQLLYNTTTSYTKELDDLTSEKRTIGCWKLLTHWKIFKIQQSLTRRLKKTKHELETHKNREAECMGCDFTTIDHKAFLKHLEKIHDYRDFDNPIIKCTVCSTETYYSLHPGICHFEHQKIPQTKRR